MSGVTDGNQQGPTPQQQAEIQNRYIPHQSRIITGVHEALLLEHAQFVKQCYWNTKHYTYLHILLLLTQELKAPKQKLINPTREQKVILSQRVTAQTAAASG